MEQHVLVTGGAGFIGSHLCERLLRDGYRVTALDDLNDFYSPERKRENLATLSRAGGGKFGFVRGTVCDAALVSSVVGGGVDQVVHMAARAGVRPSLESPALYQRVNVEGTANVLEAARLSGVNKVVLASSSSVYGSLTAAPFTEDAPLTSPISPYAASKIGAEALSRVWHSLYGMDIAVLRLFTVYGPRQRPDLAIHRFARLMREGLPLTVFGDGSTARDYTYVDDVVEGIAAALRRLLGYQVVNLGGSRPVSLSRLIVLLEEALGVRAEIDRLPQQPGDVERTWADVRKAQALLDYEPSVGLEEGIQRFARWFMATAGPWPR